MKSTTKKRAPRGPYLTSIGHVINELGVIYRLVRHNKMAAKKSYALTNILNILMKGLESGDLEKRIEELEEMTKK